MDTALCRICGERPTAQPKVPVCEQCLPKFMAELLDVELIDLSQKYSTPTKLERWVRLGPQFQEDVFWTKDVLPRIRDLPSNIVDICNYGFTEMANNANDHSGHNVAIFDVDTQGEVVSITVTDRGIGIFRKIKDHFGLEDERHAIFELAKGKLTTDQSRHTGEGIFYTSRMFDEFRILSGQLYLSYDHESDFLIPVSGAPVRGTVVVMQIKKDSTRTAKEVFDRYTGGEDFGFGKTVIAVSMADEGDSLMSRSHAKRIMHRVGSFKEVVLNFEGIRNVGPAFTDEVFRVFQNAHPDLVINVVRANDDVAKMIEKARAQRTAGTSA